MEGPTGEFSNGTIGGPPRWPPLSDGLGRPSLPEGGFDDYGSGIKGSPVVKSFNAGEMNVNKGAQVAYCAFFPRVCTEFNGIRAWRTLV